MKGNIRLSDRLIVINNIMRSYNVKLSSGEIPSLQTLLKLQRDIVNHCFQTILEHKPVLSLKIIHDLLYYSTRDKFPQAGSQLVVKCEQEALAMYKSIVSNEHEIKQAPMKKKLSLRLDKRIFKFTSDSSLLITTLEGRKSFTFKPYPKLAEMWKTCEVHDPLIFEKNREIWLSLSFSDALPTFVEGEVLGVDLGIKRLITTSDGNAIISKPHLKRKRAIRYLKDSLRARKTKSARKHLRKLSRAERNQTKNMVHTCVNEILKTDKPVIAIEDLTQIKQDTKKGKKFNNKHSQIPYYLIKQMLFYKAPLKGKRVATVNPAYTSQNDHRGLERGKRQGCRYYAKDGKVFDADWNAAVNIAKKLAHAKKLPLSFKEPLDGTLNLTWQGAVNHPIVCQSLREESLTSLWL